MEPRRLTGWLALIVVVCAVALLVYFQYRAPGPEPLPAAVSTAEPGGTPPADTTIVKTPEPTTDSASSARSMAPSDSPAPAAESTTPAGDSPAAPPEPAPSTEVATAEPDLPAEPASPSQAPADVTTPADAGMPPDRHMPSFDIVRVEPTGETVVAGQAAPKARVEILDGFETIATAEANEFGEWAIPIEKPLPPGTHDLAIRTTSSDQKTVTLSDQRVAVSVPSAGSKDVLVVLNAPDAASRVLQEAPAEIAAGGETKTPPDEPRLAVAEGRKPQEQATSGAADGSSSASAEPAAPSATGQEGVTTTTAGTGGVASADQQQAAASAPPTDEAQAAEAEASAGTAVGSSAPAAEEQVAAAPAAGEQGSAATGPDTAPAPASQSGATTTADAKPSDAGTPGASATAGEASPAEPDTEVAAVEPDQQATAPVVTAQPADEAAAAPEEPAATPEPTPAAEAPAAPEPAPVVEAPPPPEVSIAAVEADTSGEIYVSGSSNGTDAVRVYMDGKLLGEATPDASGKWTLQATRDMPAGLYQLRADQLGGDGRVIARAEVPFEREVEVAILKPVAGAGAASGTRIAGAMPEMQTVVIKRGDNLWRLSRTWYGKGKRWATLYTANKDQIRNPRWIYPGQVFMVPAGDLTWQN